MIGKKDVAFCRTPSQFDQKHPRKYVDPILSDMNEKVAEFRAAHRKLVGKSKTGHDQRQDTDTSEQVKKKARVDLNKIPSHLKHILG